MVSEAGTTVDLISVVLIDDHEVTRRGVRALLECDPAITISGEASESDEAISLIRRIRPDVAVVDIRLESGSGIEVSKAVVSPMPNTRVIIFTAYDDDRYVRSLIKLGVSGYLLKSCSARELRDGIHDVAEGKLAFPSNIAAKVLEALRDDCRHRGDDLAAIPGLTNRESTIFGHIGSGLKDREIAETLGISPRTVEVHVRNVLRKLGASSRPQAVLIATRKGLL